MAYADDELGSEFFRDAVSLKSQKEIPEFAKRYGFIQETDSERLNFFQNKKSDTTIQILSPNGLYISLRHDGYEKTCAAAKEMANAVLVNPISSKNELYWPEQATIMSSWKGQDEQSHVSLYCEQYDETGSSNIGIRIKLSK
ncbi:hypothetical protein [uncultured Cocleimonas sp.]|uniref:hypothetical protein n=1 Tax=uncultured Cocleimonas sp. TaxID=1051587 RepID=UPI0026277DAF|nr:hypothetical protein [uncultured Cocleimonas sp.]